MADPIGRMIGAPGEASRQRGRVWLACLLPRLLACLLPRLLAWRTGQCCSGEGGIAGRIVSLQGYLGVVLLPPAVPVMDRLRKPLRRQTADSKHQAGVGGKCAAPTRSVLQLLGDHYLSPTREEPSPIQAFRAYPVTG